MYMPILASHFHCLGVWGYRGMDAKQRAQRAKKNNEMSKRRSMLIEVLSEMQGKRAASTKSIHPLAINDHRSPSFFSTAKTNQKEGNAQAAMFFSLVKLARLGFMRRPNLAYAITFLGLFYILCAS